jgi:hypothetical protein
MLFIKKKKMSSLKSKKIESMATFNFLSKTKDENKMLVFYNRSLGMEA